jgi:protein-L-isoaspartate(D-aspartate) O-methyltransferase
VPDQSGRLVSVFASTARERFLGPGPWSIFSPVGYIETPSEDPAFLYQDVIVALAKEQQINNGQPVLHALCLAALNPKPGESVVHIGADTGYYTALLSQLVTSTGVISAYEIEADLAKRAEVNLAESANVTVHNRSGAEGPLPECDGIYVNAGAIAPLETWLDALRPGGRLLFPLTPAGAAPGVPGAGGMLLITRTVADRYEARFLCLRCLLLAWVPAMSRPRRDWQRHLNEETFGMFARSAATVRPMKRAGSRGTDGGCRLLSPSNLDPRI